MNERNCECGCGMGSIATCVKKDPNCPRSPGLAKLAIDLAKQGKGIGEILAAIDDQQKPAPGAAAPAAAPPPAASHKVPLNATMPRTGPKVAKVTIAEFSDFQCPFCKRVEPTVKEILQKYPNDVAIVFINQPLPFHEHAMEAAQAFQAAHRQGKAWPMHDKMYDNNTALERANLEKYAQDIGLNVSKFKKDMDDPKIKEEIAEHQKLANVRGRQRDADVLHQRPADRRRAAVPRVPEDHRRGDQEGRRAGQEGDAAQGRLPEADGAGRGDAAARAGAGAPEAPAAKVDIKIGDAPVKGPASAKVTVIEFSDFQCPFCGRVNPTLKEIEDQYKGKIKIAFRNLPLPFHDKAHLAAEAALAANEQGKFWAMHDKLFANQQALDRPSLEKYAQELGLNMNKFTAALDSGKFKDKVDSDAKEGAAVGATGTPTFFINGTRLVGAQPADKFKEVIDAELKK